jgi:hypothetical protein
VFYPAAALILWNKLRQKGPKGYAEIAILTGCCLAVILPWMIRNAVQVGSFAPRTGAGVNLRMGNSDGAYRLGHADLSIYPANSAVENALLHTLGESGYDRYCARLGLDYIGNHPLRFAILTLWRIRDWWFGLGSEWQGNLKGSLRLSALKQLSAIFHLPFFAIGCLAAWGIRKRVGLLLAIVLLYPAPYYLLIVSNRYRYPIEPLVVLMSSYGAVVTWNWLRARAKTADALDACGLG